MRLWKGYHHPELMPLIQDSWERGELLVLCPPPLKDFSFLRVMPDDGELTLHGSWAAEEREAVRAIKRGGVPAGAALGVFTSGTLSHSPRLVLYSRANVLAALDGIFSLFELSCI